MVGKKDAGYLYIAYTHTVHSYIQREVLEDYNATVFYTESGGRYDMSLDFCTRHLPSHEVYLCIYIPRAYRYYTSTYPYPSCTLLYSTVLSDEACITLQPAVRACVRQNVEE